MKITKIIATFLLSLSIALAGVPAFAKQPCPAAAKMQMQQMEMKDCKSCANMAKQEPKKNGCCDDAACNAKCSAMGGGVAMNLPTYKTELPAVSEQAKRLYPAAATIASAHLSSQERPPKSLA